MTAGYRDEQDVAPIIEDRVSAPENPGGLRGSEEAALEHALWVLGVDYSERLCERVDRYTALTYAAFWACVRIISQTIATLGWHVYETTANGRGKDPIHDDIAWLLNTQPNPEMTAVDFRGALVKDALIQGNGYAEIERDGYGRPVWLWRLDPDRVEPRRYPDTGQLYYCVSNGTNKNPSELDPSQVFHLKGMSPDGLVGYSVIHVARKTIALGMDQERYGTNFFRRGSMPGGILKMPGGVKKEERDAARESFEQTYGGARNAGRVVVISGGMEFTTATIPNGDAQWLESRRFQIEEIARFFGVPLHKLGELMRSTNNNIEQQAMEFVQDCLLPWCRKLEAEADIKMFGRVNRGKRWTKLNLNALLRGDSKTQTANLTSLVTNGLLTPNEGREQLDYNPNEDGDTLLIQGAMVPLHDVIDPPAPPAPPAAPAVKPVPNPEPDPAVANPTPKDVLPFPGREDATRVFQVLLTDCWARLLRVEADKARRAQNRGQLREWAREFFGKIHQEHVALTLQPLLEGFCLARGQSIEGAGEAAQEAAQRHCREGVQDLDHQIVAVERWSEEWIASAEVLARENIAACLRWHTTLAA